MVVVIADVQVVICPSTVRSVMSFGWKLLVMIACVSVSLFTFSVWCLLVEVKVD